MRALILALGLMLLPAGVLADPALLLARTYRPGTGVDLGAYWVSEKYDGVRGYWDGRQLWTRGGEPIAAPAWFTAGWPATPLDGELWAGRGGFARAAGTVRQQVAVEADWRQLRYLVFDLPAHPGTFDERLVALEAAVAAISQPWVQAVVQFRVASEGELRRRLAAVVADGGEGLMLHRGDSRYQAGRSDDLLKVKPYDDGEARVVGYLPGKGKYRGQLGALLVETPEGRRFGLGSGLDDAARRNPPPVGTWVTYRHNGLTEHGLPRFPRYLRVRADWSAGTAAR